MLAVLMAKKHPKPASARLHKAITLLLIANGLYLLVSIPSLLLSKLSPDVFLNLYFNYGFILGVQQIAASATMLSICVLIPISLQGLIHLRIFQTRRQIIAARIIQFLMALQIPFWIGLLLSSIDFAIHPPSGLGNQSLPGWFGEILFNLWVMKYNQYSSVILSIAVITLMLPPSFARIIWPQRTEQITRITLIIFATTPLLWFVKNRLKDLERYLYTTYLFEFPSFFKDGITFMRNLFEDWAAPFVPFILLVIIIILWRKSNTLITDDPNHCPACAYPLDSHMTTCPECGTKCSIQPEPVPE